MNAVGRELGIHKFIRKTARYGIVTVGNMGMIVSTNSKPQHPLTWFIRNVGQRLITRRIKASKKLVAALARQILSVVRVFRDFGVFS